MKKKTIILILILAALLYILYKRGVFSSKKEGGTSMWSDSSSPTDFQTIPANALYADYRAELEFYVRKLNIDEARELTASRYPTDELFRKQVNAWVKSIWLSAKNNTKWTQANVSKAAASNGVTYSQQIVKDAVWEMGQAEKRVETSPEKQQQIEDAFNRLQRTVEDM
ncbi:MAG: hypothetical protein MJZ90_06185 [Bacteroidales bacterium]|nr:hypothetical protein [Bacteroidales bacterium]